MRIVIVADSLGLLRKSIVEEQIWPHLIINKYKDYHEIFTFLKGGRSTKYLDT